MSQPNLGRGAVRGNDRDLPFGFVLTGGEASDYTAADVLMAAPVAKPKAMFADKGLDGAFPESLQTRGTLPIIPPSSNCKVPEHPDHRRYKERNGVERMFAKL